ncbi:hypothetical protein CCDG5_0378 [[Clostridium] cellulosi]|jgi:Anti-sigma-28 factor, FlgM.|uniref:Anti-sigma-28 factor FlgM C-terminal domain-containing protein n=1 Tax=[Clostridium] cellulosi TaxID=29343 RepID=A0A078KLZ6_9FIRM|nr:MAG: flagellar biosynthesis anti-sigma factor FlgM [[Clostridium] cellulosi]CDZ23517.1 hypothetical protein CCDG5_0378 [[Clostridium] cellulosi]
MKINGLQPQEVYKTYVNNIYKSGAEIKKAVISDTDSLTISQQSSDLYEARRLADESGILDVNEEGREERIEELKSLIDSGQYNVSAEDVAKSIVSGKIFDNRA